MDFKPDLTALLDDIDLSSREGRKEYLTMMAKLCIGGFYVETIGPKSERTYQLKQVNPQAGIRAIIELGKLSDGEMDSNFIVNIMRDDYDDEEEDN